MSQITTIFQAVLEAQAKTSKGGTNGNVDSTKKKRKWDTRDNGMPNAQRSELRHFKATHNATNADMTFKKTQHQDMQVKKNRHKDDAINKNRMEGSERNCFHFTCKWRYWRINKYYSSLNKVTNRQKYLNETLSNLSSISNNNTQHKTTKMVSLTLKQHEMAYPDTSDIF